MSIPVSEFLLKNALHIALNAGVRCVVPNWITEDDEVSAAYIHHFFGDISWRFAEPVFGLIEIFTRKNRVEANGVKVTQLYVITLVHEMLHGRIDEIPFNRFASLIAHDEENALNTRAKGKTIGLHALTEGLRNHGCGCDSINILGYDGSALGRTAAGARYAVGSLNSQCGKGKRKNDSRNGGFHKGVAEDQSGTNDNLEDIARVALVKQLLCSRND